MMYLVLCAASAVMFVIFAICAIASKKGKRAALTLFSVVFFAAAVLGGAAYYTGFGNMGKKTKEISEYCGADINELINATKLEFKNISDDIYETDGISLCRRDGKIMYLDLTSGDYMIHGFSGEFSKENTVYNGKKTQKNVHDILQENRFEEISEKYAETEFTDYDESNICVYDTKGRILVFSFNENGTGKNIRYFPNPSFAETLVKSTVSLSDDVSTFLSETDKLTSNEKEYRYTDECGKCIVWQVKTTDVYGNAVSAERNGTKFTIYPLPQFLSKSALPEKDEYIEVIGLFDGYTDGKWVVKNAIVKRNVSVEEAVEIVGTYKNKSSEIKIDDENGRLHLSGTSNYGAYSVDGYIEKINDTTYLYDGKEGDFYIALTDSGVEITTDTLKSFEGDYAKE